MRPAAVVSALLLALSSFGLTACESRPPAAPPRQDTQIKTPRDWTLLTPEEAINAVQRVPGARAFSLGVESPESVHQEVRDRAQVEMVLNNDRLTMMFERHGEQWDWVAATSPTWPGQRKSPAEVVAWGQGKK